MSAGDPDFRAPHLRGGDFLGVFAVVERAGRILMVQNERLIDGRNVRTWDLPGGQVEPGELLHEALARELREESRLELAGAPQFLFVQEGGRYRGGRRAHAWRSFFFAVATAGDAQAAGEVLALHWFPRAELDAVLLAPYHASFRRWLTAGGTFFGTEWRDAT